MSEGFNEAGPYDSTFAGGKELAVSTALREVTAIVAAEGDVKLVAELLHKDVDQLLVAFLENKDLAVELTKAQMVLNCLQIMGNLTPKIIESLDTMPAHVAVQLFRQLVESIELLDKKPNLTQNNTNVYADQSTLEALARRMGVQVIDGSAQPT